MRFYYGIKWLLLRGHETYHDIELSWKTVVIPWDNKTINAIKKSQRIKKHAAPNYRTTSILKKVILMKNERYSSLIRRAVLEQSGTRKFMCCRVVAPSGVENCRRRIEIWMAAVQTKGPHVKVAHTRPQWLGGVGFEIGLHVRHEHAMFY